MSREEAEKVRVALPAPGHTRPGISPHLALSVGTVCHFPGRREDFGGWPRLVHTPATAPGCSRCARYPKSPAGRWRHGLSLLPVLVPAGTAQGWEPSSLTDPRVNLWGVLIHRNPPKLDCPLPLRASGQAAPFLLPSCGGFRRRCLAQRCGLHGGWGAGSVPGTVH